MRTSCAPCGGDERTRQAMRRSEIPTALRIRPTTATPMVLAPVAGREGPEAVEVGAPGEVDPPLLPVPAPATGAGAFAAAAASTTIVPCMNGWMLQL